MSTSNVIQPDGKRENQLIALIVIIIAIDRELSISAIFRRKRSLTSDASAARKPGATAVVNPSESIQDESSSAVESFTQTVTDCREKNDRINECPSAFSPGGIMARRHGINQKSLVSEAASESRS